METLSVGGLVSGLDTNSIIDGLTDLELAKVKRVENKQRDVEVKLNTFNELQGKIAEFAGKADLLDDIKAFNLFESETSDEKIATISGTEEAIPGSFEVEVKSLASRWKVTSEAYSNQVDPLGLIGKFEISRSKDAIDNDPSNPTVEIEVDANDSLKDLVAKINSAEGRGASATIINLGENDYRMVVSAVDEGSEGFFIKDTGASNILDADGLGMLDYRQRIQSDFSLKLATVGAASTTNLFSELHAGIGLNSQVDAGDEIQISGNDANGNSVSGTFTIGAASTIQDLLNSTKTVFESQGAAVDVSLNNSGEIVITDGSGGVAEMTLAMTFTDANSSGSELSLTHAGGSGKVQNNFTHILNEGKKAFFRVDGLSMAAESNKDEDTVTGTVFELHKAEPGSIVELSLERDFDAIKEKVQDFLNAYNGVLQFLNEKSKVQIENQEDPNKKETISSSGPFAGDSTIMRIKSDLQLLVTSTIPELNTQTRYTSLASIGITSSVSDSTLSIDEEDFKKALQVDFEGVRSLFISSGFSDNPNHNMGIYSKDTKTGTYEIDADNDKIDEDKDSAGSTMAAAGRNGDVLTSESGDSKGLSIDAPAGSGTGIFSFVRGVAGQISHYWGQASDNFEGSFTQTTKSLERTIESFKERAEVLEKRADTFRQRLIRQFADLEMSMSRLQSQSASFQAQIGAL